MDPTLLTNARWSLLAALAPSVKSVTQLAERAGTSVATASQQARLLEAHGLIKASKDATGNGRPTTVYGLTHAVAHISILSRAGATRGSLRLTCEHEALLRSMLWGKRDDHAFLAAFLTSSHIAAKAAALAVTETTPQELHILVITTAEHLEELRATLSKSAITVDGVTRTVVCWTHTKEEMREGVARNEEYFVRQLQKPHILCDKEGFFTEVRG